MQSVVKNCNNNENNYEKQIIPDVVTLNVGGCIFTTSLATLQKSPQSMLAAMFSGRHLLKTDSCGRFFIDRSGFLFEHILNFLRQGQLPPLDVSLKVYEEAEFFNLIEMCDALEMFKPVTARKLRDKFLDQVPLYHENVAGLLTEARKSALMQPDRVSKLRVSIFKEEQHSITHDINSTTSHMSGKQLNPTQPHCCDVNITFGPWKGNPGVYDLVDCIKDDLALKGYDIECQCIGVCDQEIWGQYFCKRPVFEFKFRWW